MSDASPESEPPADPLLCARCGHEMILEEVQACPDCGLPRSETLAQRELKEASPESLRRLRLAALAMALAAGLGAVIWISGMIDRLSLYTTHLWSYAFIWLTLAYSIIQLGVAIMMIRSREPAVTSRFTPRFVRFAAGSLSVCGCLGTLVFSFAVLDAPVPASFDIVPLLVLPILDVLAWMAILCIALRLAFVMQRSRLGLMTVYVIIIRGGAFLFEAIHRCVSYFGWFRDSITGPPLPFYSLAEHSHAIFDFAAATLCIFFAFAFHQLLRAREIS